MLGFARYAGYELMAHHHWWKLLKNKECATRILRIVGYFTANMNPIQEVNTSPPPRKILRNF